METANAVGDGKLDNDEMGILFRRMMEVVRRIEQGSIEKRAALKALQMIIESKAPEVTSTCRRRHRRDLVLFIPPASKERRKSRAPIHLRLEKYLNRLGIYDTLRLQNPGGKYPDQHPEDIMALMWEAENIPRPWLNEGRVPVNTILDDPSPSERDRAIVATTLQWLGTNCGRDFLARFVAAADLDM